MMITNSAQNLLLVLLTQHNPDVQIGQRKPTGKTKIQFDLDFIDSFCRLKSLISLHLSIITLQLDFPQKDNKDKSNRLQIIPPKVKSQTIFTIKPKEKLKLLSKIKSQKNNFTRHSQLKSIPSPGTIGLCFFL